MQIDEFIALIPKAELNIHIEGCLSEELVTRFAERNKIILSTPHTIQFTDLSSFLKIYYAALQVLLTEEDFYDLGMAYFHKAAMQNIRHAEVSFDPQAHVSRGVALSTVIKGLTRAVQEAKAKYGISAFLIMCFMRDLSEEEAIKIFEEALIFKDHIVAIGLDSTEKGNPPEKFKNLFDLAHAQGFLSVAIAGETGSPDYIWQALDVLHVSRIGHGVQCMQDPDLITRLAAKQIPVDVCPISNVKLGIYPQLKQHPLKKMYEDGLCVTLNSDDPAYFDAYLNENYIAANAALKLNKTIIYELAKNSFSASFLDYARQEKLMSELEKVFKQAVS
ncbi:MAG: adenosine deaminase [Gammaproteobacteria bacterium]|nr:adenosine deaminase [Gammaproteobacteria bacterium]